MRLEREARTELPLMTHRALASNDRRRGAALADQLDPSAAGMSLDQLVNEQETPT